MKRLNYFAVFLVTTTLLFTSCSKEDDSGILENENAKTATLSFGAVLNDLMDNKGALKQEVPVMPECSDEAPASVEVVLSLNGTYVVGDPGSPVNVPVNPAPYDYDNDGEDEYFTDESSDLELPPGDYVLEYFQVLDATGNVIWSAPISTGSGNNFAGLVNNALPMDISLGAGVKRYVPVEVLCFDDRVVNEYGYLFFDIEGSEAIEFCLFGNVCDENGRHYPANFRFDVWTYSGDAANPQGAPLFDENNPYVNITGVNDDGDAYADPLCLFLPDTDGEDVYYGELYIIENGTSTLIRASQFTDENVRDIFDGDDNVDYYHFREGCGGNDTPGWLQTETGEPTITSDTNIYIYFDSSGSMNTTLQPLQEMRNTLLRDALIGLYNNDQALYDSKVQVLSEWSERTFDFLNIQGDTPSGDVIALVFQDEAVSIYTDSYGWDENSTRTSTFESDIATLRSRVESFPANTYRGVIFQVSTPNYPGAPEFKQLVQAVENGTGNYSGEYGLSDRSEFGFVYDVNPGASASYYEGLVRDALTDLGYDL